MRRIGISGGLLSRGLSAVVLVIAGLLFASLGVAGDFTAKTLGDYGNVTVMEVSGNYDKYLPDGTDNNQARQAVAREFYRTHKDNYDFLVIFTNFDYAMTNAETLGFYTSIKNDVQGIGLEQFDHAASFGSDGRLQGTVDMGNLSALATNPIDPGYEESLATLNHELLHRWSAHLKFKAQDGSVSDALLGRDGSHWSFLLDTNGSLHYGNDWVDNGDGTFTSVARETFFSPLDLYLMGMIGKEDVPPLTLIENPSIDPERLPRIGETISGTARTVTIDDIIVAMGARVPAVADAPKRFSMAFIYLAAPGSFASGDLYGIESLRNGFLTRFSILTDGQGLVRVAVEPQDDLPTNPGLVVREVTPRTLPPDIEEGVQWLTEHQEVDGSWRDSLETRGRDTTEALSALRLFSAAPEGVAAGLSWLEGSAEANTDYLARKLEAFVAAGRETSALVGELVARRNSDGGWGSARGFVSNPVDTALVVKALGRSGYGDQTVLNAALGYLLTAQNADGGWGLSRSLVQPTANVMLALSHYQDQAAVEVPLTNAVAWLSGRQNTDGGFGNSPSTVYDSAVALAALSAVGSPSQATVNGTAYLWATQTENGSWYDSPYQTASAVQALWKATRDPDLAISVASISFVPETITSLPTQVVVRAEVSNLGRVDVPSAIVALYDGAVTEANLVEQQSMAFPAQTSVVLTFAAPIADGNQHRFTMVVDPANLVLEQSESNNKAAKILKPESSYDLAVASGDVHLSTAVADINDTVSITATVKNAGTSDAYDVPVRIFVQDGATIIDIATRTVTVTAGGATEVQANWVAVRSGAGLEVHVVADPQNIKAELAEDNNDGMQLLTINGSPLPNLAVSHGELDIAPNPAMQAGSAVLTAVVRNQGYSPVASVEVRFYRGAVGANAVLLGTQTIAGLAASESIAVSIPWADIAVAGNHLLTVVVDPDNLVAEITEADNQAFITFGVLSLPDLKVATTAVAIEPMAPKENDPVAIRVVVQNGGEQTAENVSVRLLESGAVIAEQVIAEVAGNGQAVAVFDLGPAVSGGHELRVEVDPDNVVLEQSELNNVTVRSYAVQSGDLWVSEPYFSPNGDNVKDTTTFGFRLGSPLTITVEVVDEEEMTVRTFSGAGLEQTLGGSVVWEGLTDSGVLADDGSYQFRLVAIDGAVLGRSSVVVDNNRSLFSDAIGTDLLNVSRLDGMCEYYSDDLIWLPDESGILVNCSHDASFVPGVYLWSSSGEGQLVTPPEWGGSAYSNVVIQYDLSPSGQQVAVTMSARDTTLPAPTTYWKNFAQLWVIDLGTLQSTMLDESRFEKYYQNYQYPSYSGTYIAGSMNSPHWSPDGTMVAYASESSGNYNYNIVHVDSGEITKFGESSGSYFYENVWSPSSKKLLLSIVGGLGVYDINSKTTLYYNLGETSYDEQWISDERILTASRDVYKVIDVKSGEFVVLKQGGGWSYPFISPDKRNIVICDINNVGGNNNFEYSVYDLYNYERKMHFYAESDYLFDRYFSNYDFFITDDSFWSGNGNYFHNIFLLYLDNAHDLRTDKSVALVIDLANRDHDEIIFNDNYTDDVDGSTWIDDNKTIFVYPYVWFQGEVSTYSDDRYVPVFINTVTGGVTEAGELPVPYAWDGMNLSPLGKQITYQEWPTKKLVRIGSLANLTTEFSANRQSSQFLLKGTAADANFAGYKLEYASSSSPESWTLITPPSNTPVIDDQMATWVPPGVGRYYVRLTVWDKAGNIASTRRQVSWGESTAIANLYKSEDIISPNGDGVKDSVDLHYRVLAPVHLEFTVLDQSNRVVRAINLDHATPGDEAVRWDGRDNQGRVVADGMYVMAVLGYRFTIEVDSTPPLTGIELGKIELESRSIPILENSFLSELKTVPKFAISGHVFDDNLQYWRIEYGAGENPSSWQVLREGTAALIGKDDKGNLVLSPPQSVTIISPEGGDIKRFAGQKFRLVAEDRAGNRATAVAAMLEDRLMFLQWDETSTLGILPAALVRRGQHVGLVMDTFASRLDGLTLQYFADEQWLDAAATIYADSRLVTFSWDTSELPDEIAAVRLKGTDAAGDEQFSNVLLVESLFGLVSECGSQPWAVVGLFERFSELRWQMQWEVDGPWLDYEVYTPSNHTLLLYNPSGELSSAIAGLPEEIQEGRYPAKIPQLWELFEVDEFRIRMWGIGESGRVYASNYATWPPRCPSMDLQLSVLYPEAGCGGVPGTTNLTARLYSSRDIVPKRLDVYFAGPQGEELLASTTSHLTVDATVDSRDLLEGDYPARAVLTYEDQLDGRLHERVVSENIVVDRQLPSVAITYPSAAAGVVCPVAQSGAGGAWFGVPVEGVFADDRRVESYALYYGVGSNPSAWMPATSPALQEGKIVQRQIKDMGALAGVVGVWDVSQLKGREYTLKLEVVDGAGNKNCHTAMVLIDTLLEVDSLSLDRQLMSLATEVAASPLQINYSIGEFATVAVRVYRLAQAQNGAFSVQGAPVRTIADGISHLSGAGLAAWDGRDDAGIAVVDGHYGVAVEATDNCGNTALKWVRVEIDSTPPTAAISYPLPGDPIKTVVDVKGVMDDVNLSSWTLAAGSSADLDNSVVVSTGSSPVLNAVLAAWNTFALEGSWTLTLTAKDRAGNETRTAVTIDQGERLTLIKALSATPLLISPNGDGLLDQVAIAYELTAPAKAMIEIVSGSGQVVRSMPATHDSSGSFSVTWDGTASTGQKSADGSYVVRLIAEMQENSALVQEESTTVEIDSTPPAVELPMPAQDAYLNATKLTVSGSIRDLNLSDYAVSYVGPAGTVLLDYGSQQRLNYTFGVTDDLAETAYQLIVEARDRGENSVRVERAFTIDRTAPRVGLTAPADKQIFGGNSAVVNIAGSVEEEHLLELVLRYGSGATPTAWHELLVSPSAMPEIARQWVVGQDSGVADGIYTLSLHARDKADLEDEKRITLTVDNTPPLLALNALSSRFVTAPVTLGGTIADANLLSAKVELSQGQCTSAYQWIPLAILDMPVTDGAIYRWQNLPEDGTYCVRLSAADVVGNSSSVQSEVIVDTHAPAMPDLSGTVENGRDVVLAWPASGEDDLAGYFVLRNGIHLNSEPSSELTFSDLGLDEGHYSYTLIAVDLAGNESASSKPATFHVDVTPPNVNLKSPLDGGVVSGPVVIKGSAFSADDFREYRLFVGADAGNLNLIKRSPVATNYGVLAEWDSLGWSEGQYLIRLEAEDLTGNLAHHDIAVVLDNTPPPAPLLLEVSANGENLTARWQPSDAEDLAGYLLYRNGQLVNASAGVVTNVKPYLLRETTYLDTSVPDGRHQYVLQAVDHAGNASEPSNSIEVTIDMRVPVARIVEPVSETRFETALTVRAEADDMDLASVAVQFRASGSTVWLAAGAPLTASPYVVTFDPAAAGLEYGDFLLRAVATDFNGNIDSAPSEIGVTFTDLTPPEIPLGIVSAVDGGNVNLTWTANGDADLAGYNVYRLKGGVTTKVNSAVVIETAYTDAGLTEAEYRYVVTAFDANGNESAPSTEAIAQIFRPVLNQPLSPTSDTTTTIMGYGASAGAMVELWRAASGGDTLVRTVPAADDGTFMAAAQALLEGGNTFFARIVDLKGNKSLPSLPVTVLSVARPQTPTGLVGTLVNSDVQLSWTPNPPSDLAGYNLYRNSQKIVLEGTVSNATATASSYYSGYGPEKALDGNESTYWYSVNGRSLPVWYEITLSTKENITGLNISWYSAYYSGNTFEVQAFIENQWKTIDLVSYNYNNSNNFEFNESIFSNRLRIFISSLNNTSNIAIIREVTIKKEGLINTTAFTDLALMDGVYRYQVSAVNSYGFESPLSEPVEILVGDVVAPQAPTTLTATVSGSEVLLDWSQSQNSEPDFAGYWIYMLVQGEWVRQNQDLVTDSSYLVSKLKNGTYSFRVTAQDATGNESQTSPEASAVITEGFVPTPVLVAPVFAGEQVIVYADEVDLKGYAAPGDTVQVFRNNQLYGAVVAQRNETVRGQTLDVDTYQADLSPDGRLLAYVNASDDALWVYDLESATRTFVTPTSYSPIWSPSGDKLAFEYWDSDGNYRIYFYEIATEEVKRLSEEPIADEFEPSWTADGRQVVFDSDRGAGYYDVWSVDIATGAMNRLTVDKDASWPKLSPDGSKLAYIEYDEVFVKDLTTGSVQSLSGDLYVQSYGSDMNPCRWSADSQRLIFTAGRDSYRDIYVADLAAGSLDQLTTAGDNRNVRWSPDGKSIVFYRVNAGVYAAGLGQMPRKIDAMEFNPVYLNWDRNNDVAFLDGYQWHTVSMPGSFTLSGVGLRIGENLFHAVASDESGGQSPASESISVIYDDSRLPDLAIRPEGIFIYPLLPKPAERLAVTATVQNRSSTAVAAVTVDAYLWEENHGMTLIGSEVVPGIEGNAQATISFATSATQLGGQSIIVVVDPDNTVVELDESNNYAEKTFVVAEQGAVDASIRLNGNQFGANQPVMIAVEVVNGQAAKNAQLDILIEDLAGETVAKLEPETVHLPYGLLTISRAWNTGDVLAGTYRARAVLRDQNAPLASDTADFVLLSNLSIDSSLAISKATYGPSETVGISVKTVNLSSNIIVPWAELHTVLLAPAGQELAAWDDQLINLLPSQASEVRHSWSIGNTPPGQYRVTTVASINGSVVDSSTAVFLVAPLANVTGSLTVDPAIVGAGVEFTALAKLSNTGNVASSGVVKIVLRNQASLTETVDVENAVELAASESWGSEFHLATEGLKLGAHNVSLEYHVAGVKTVLDDTTITLKDILPPEVVILAPQDQGAYEAEVRIVASVVDRGTGVNAVEYRIDSGAWRKMGLADPEGNRFASVWTPAAADSGLHLIEIRGTDGAGNTSQPVSVRIDVQQDNMPPVTDLTIGLPRVEGGSSLYVAAATQVLLVASDEISEVALTEYRFDGGVWQPYVASISVAELGDGMHSISYRSTDAFGNLEEEKFLSVYLDRTSPSTTIAASNPSFATEVGPFFLTAEDTVTLSAVDDGSGVASTEFRIDGGGWSAYEPFMLTEEETHTIDFRSRDRLDNLEAIRTISVNMDNSAPQLVMTKPLEGGVYNHELTPQFNIIDANPDASKTVILLNGLAYAAGTPISAEGDYILSISTTDKAGNQSSVEVHFAIDLTAPAIMIDAVADRAFYNAGLIPLISVADDTLVDSSITLNGTPYVRGTLIETEGVYELVVSAGDAAGNTASQKVNFTIDLSVPEISVGEVEDGAYYNRAVVPVIAVNDDNLVESGCTLNDETYPPGTPISMEGSYHLVVTARDRAGNESMRSLSFVIDLTAPLVAITSPVDGSFDNAEVLPQISVSDLNLDDALSSLTLNGQPYVQGTSVSDEGTYELVFSATDRAGNRTSASVTFAIDKTAPVTTITVGLPQYANVGTLYVTAETLFSLSAVDAMAGVAATEYRIDGGEWMAYAPFGLTTAGDHMVEYRSRDQVGNLEGIQSLSVVFDAMPPDMALTIDHPQFTDVTGLFVSSATLFNVTAEDSFAGVAAIEYRIDDGDWNPFSPFSVQSEGQHVITYRAKDNLGNCADAQTLALTVDNTAPVSKVSICDPQSVADGTIYIGAQTSVELNADDSLAGIERIEVRLDDGDWQVYSAALTLVGLGEGEHTLRYRAIDRVANLEEAKTLALVVDHTAPLTTIDVATPQLADASGQLYVTSSTSFSLSVADDLSGVSLTQYRIDNGDWKASAPFTIPDEGPHRIEYRSADNVANLEATRSLFVIVDNFAPVSKISVSDPRYFAAEDHLYVAATSRFTVTAEDDWTGVASLECRIDNEEWTSESPFSIASEGTHRIECRSIDLLGNQEESQILEATVDNTAPVTKPTLTLQGYVGGNTLLASKASQITLAAEDALAGVEATFYRFGGEVDWSRYTGVLNASALDYGSHQLHFYSVDHVGNREEEHVLAFTLVGAEVEVELLNRPRVLVWTEDPATIKGRLAPNYTLEDIEALITDALGAKDAYVTLVADKDAFLTQFRSGLFNTVMVLNQDVPFGANILRELREAVARGSIGLLISSWGNNVHPILQGMFGLDFVGSMPMNEDQRALSLFDSAISTQTSLTAYGRILKTRLDGGILAGMVPGERQCNGLRSVSFSYPQSIATGDLIRATVYTPKGKKLTLVEEEQLAVGDLPAAGVNNFSGNPAGDLMIDAVSDDSVSFTIGSSYGYLGENYVLAVRVEHADGTVDESGMVTLNPTCTGNLTAGMAVGPFHIDAVEDDKVQVSDDLPAVILSTFGKGRTVFLAYNILESAMRGDFSVHADLLGNAADHLLPVFAGIEPARISLLETRITFAGTSADLLAIETLDPGLTHLPLFDLTKTPLAYRFHLDSGEQASYRYFVRFPDQVGEYRKQTELQMEFEGMSIPYDVFAHVFSVSTDSGNLLQQALLLVESMKSDNSALAGALDDILSDLQVLGALPKTSDADYEAAIGLTMQIIQDVQKLSGDATALQDVLAEYLRIMWALGSQSN